MKMLLIGAILGFTVATVGVGGAVVLLEKGVTALKEYVPSAEQHIEDIKRWGVEATK
jgi:hypothetical protein